MRIPSLIALLAISLTLIPGCDRLDIGGDDSDGDPKEEITALLLEIDDIKRSGDADEIRDVVSVPPELEDSIDDEAIKADAEMYADTFDPLTEAFLDSDATDWDIEDDTAIVTISSERGDGVETSYTTYLIREDGEWGVTTNSEVSAARTDVLDDPDEVIETELTTEDSFDHYGLMVHVGTGIEARLDLNGSEISTFDDPTEPGDASINLTPRYEDLLRRGEDNKLDLIVTYVGDEVSPALFGVEAIVDISLHGINEGDDQFPTDDNRVLHLNWGDPDSEEMSVRWVFELN